MYLSTIRVYHLLEQCFFRSGKGKEKHKDPFMPLLRSSALLGELAGLIAYGCAFRVFIVIGSFLFFLLF